MLDRSGSILRRRALIVDDGLAQLETSIGRAAEGLARALEERDVDVVRALSLEDGRAIVVVRRLAPGRPAGLGPRPRR